jgi:hypothetical protein
MSQVDISLFSTITQTVSILGIGIYSIWLVYIFYFFMKNLAVLYKVINKNIQTTLIVGH